MTILVNYIAFRHSPSICVYLAWLDGWPWYFCSLCFPSGVKWGKTSILGICNQFLTLECVTRLKKFTFTQKAYTWCFCGRYFQVGIENKLDAKCDSRKWHCILILCVFGFFTFLTSIVLLLNIFGVYPRSAVQCQARSLTLRKCLHRCGWLYKVS